MAHFRLAPTPSGYLHAGNGYNFLWTYLLAKKEKAKLSLRIDDLDEARKRPEYVADIFQTLDWLGIQPDGGPSSPEELEKKYSQRFFRAEYRTLLEALKSEGFACQCSRKAFLAASTDGQYPGTCHDKKLKLEKGKTSFRLKTENTVTQIPSFYQKSEAINLHETMRDFVLWRKDDLPAYQLASVADDLRLGITHIVRGTDLLASSAAQVFLAKKADLGVFENLRFFHHPLLTQANGEKLSKSASAPPLREWRERPRGRAAFLRSFARWIKLPAKKYEKIADVVNEFLVKN